ncbi:MAG: hypothetical protein F8N36_13120 [Desulfovibrio sp.]|uniref:hypothetical protein n=1 Tax=Desulfovibrio sp. TaxID=885 RepID=UPI00135D2349|nr:hypothetical protein [Desulfovibrio sp.]MTJ93782.1 hypothetical protein [Desulfovibrio sp.]
MDTSSHRRIAGYQGQLGRLANNRAGMQKVGNTRLLSFREHKRSRNMSKTWVFIGGMVAGIAGVFAAAFAAEEFDARKQPGRDGTIENKNILALPEAE